MFMMDKDCGGAGQPPGRGVGISRSALTTGSSCRWKKTILTVATLEKQPGFATAALRRAAPPSPYRRRLPIVQKRAGAQSVTRRFRLCDVSHKLRFSRFC
jgi:hypothetical protein